MTDYTIVHHPDEDKPWFVMDSDLIFDTFTTEQEAIDMVKKMDQCGLFRERVQMLVEEFSDGMDIRPMEFIHMVENSVGRTIRGLWSE